MNLGSGFFFLFLALKELATVIAEPSPEIWSTYFPPEQLKSSKTHCTSMMVACQIAMLFVSIGMPKAAAACFPGPFLFSGFPIVGLDWFGELKFWLG